jgi:hypothetical protein
MADIPQSAYDSAIAVFSRSFRFVEWKHVIAWKGDSAPFGDRDAPAHMAVKPIGGTKWIYVFRQDVGEQYAAIKEEIRVDANGQMFATPWDRIELPIAKRGTPVAVGKTMSLPRRLLGKPKVYRFYASRVRLPVAQIKALEKTISTFAPRTVLEPGTNGSVIEHNGQLLVPVVDPVTVALHLHAAFSAAADDVIHYTAAHDGLPAVTRKTVERRRKKHLLATLLKGIIGEEKNVGANNLVDQLKSSQGPLEDFLVHYDQQLEWRVKRRDWLANVLVSWLRSDAIAVAAAAHKTFGKDLWVRFLVPWCHLLTRLFEAPIGRAYLAGLLEDKKHFVHTFVWPQKEVSNEAFQAIRKGGMTIFEAWAALVETRILIKGGDYVPEIVTSLRLMRRLKPAEKLSIKFFKELVAIDRTIEAVKLIDPGPVETVRHFAAEAKSLGAVMESVNLILAIKATADAMQGEDPKVKELALINLVGSSLDATSAIASLLKKSERVIHVLGFVSGVIDVYLGVKEMSKAFAEGDQDIANGAFLTAAGATFGTAGAAMGLLAIPGGQAVIVLGLAIVAIGLVYKWIKGKEPLERFFEHCSWGKKHDLIRAGKLRGGADWSPTRFEQWTGDREFDYQLEALLNIICKIDISYNDTFRDLRFKAGWLPLNSKLLVLYQEKWQDAAQPLKIESEILLTHKGPTSKDSRLAVTADGQNGVKVKVVSGVPSTSPNQTRPMGGIRLPHPSLENAFAAGRLVVTFEGALPMSVPHDKPAKRTFHR